MEIPLTKALNYFFSYKEIRNLKTDLRNLYNCRINFLDLHGKGACSTLLATDSSGKKLCVAKLSNWYNELRSKKINSILEFYIYYPPYKRFLKEYQILNRLSEHRLSPKPIKITNDYLIEEYLEGPSLRKLLLTSAISFLDIHIMAFKVLDKMHKLGIYHGEPSLDNMIYTSGGVKIIDFEHFLNEASLTKDEMEAIDFFRFLINSDKNFPSQNRDDYQKLGEFLKKEIAEDIIEKIRKIIKFPFFRNDIRANKMLNLIDTKGKKVVNFEIENISSKKDLTNLIVFYANEESIYKNKAKKIVYALYKRFPLGFFRAKKDGEIIGFISLGFQKPSFLMYLISKLPIILPASIVNLLIKYKIIRTSEVANIYVSRQHRNMGIGRTLIDYGENFVKQHLHQKEINLLVQERNTPAISLYKKMNYIENSFIKTKKGHKIKMKKTLARYVSGMIAFIGVDGAGKTTTALRLKEYLGNRQIPCRIVYMGRGRDRALPGAREVAKKLGLNLPEPKTLPHIVGIKGKILCFLRDLVYMLDVYARYLKFICPFLKKGEIVITDRYAYDILLNENHHAIIKFLLFRLYPKPDYLFYLYHEPTVLQERKGQKTVEELVRHIDVLKSFKKELEKLNYKNIYELKTDSINDNLRQIIDIIERD